MRANSQSTVYFMTLITLVLVVSSDLIKINGDFYLTLPFVLCVDGRVGLLFCSETPIVCAMLVLVSPTANNSSKAT